MSGDAGGVGGTYTLLVPLEEAATPTVGALGDLALPAGHYAYTGSALGPGGFARVDRHRAVAAGERDVRQWHVDHLLGLGDASVEAVVRSPGLAAECEIAGAVGGTAVPGFGASDCDCGSHLSRSDDGAALYESAWAAHEAAGGGTGSI